jgi:hypothetical protein
MIKVPTSSKMLFSLSLTAYTKLWPKMKFVPSSSRSSKSSSHSLRVSFRRKQCWKVWLTWESLKVNWYPLWFTSSISKWLDKSCLMSMETLHHLIFSRLSSCLLSWSSPWTLLSRSASPSQAKPFTRASLVPYVTVSTLSAGATSADTVQAILISAQVVWTNTSLITLSMSY